jgi:hypothetical protein
VEVPEEEEEDLEFLAIVHIISAVCSYYLLLPWALAAAEAAVVVLASCRRARAARVV